MSPRNKSPIKEAHKSAQDNYEAVKKLLGDSANYYVAKMLLGLGDVYLEKKEFETAEQQYH